MKSLDLDADPCEDFYQFTCGNWAANHPIPDFTASTDWFFERKLHLAQRIRKVLEQDPLADQPILVTQAQMLFQSCLNTSSTWTIPMTQPSDSHPDLVEVSSRSTYLKRATTPSHKSNLQRRLVAVIILLAILAAALVIAVGILSYNSNKMSYTVLEPQVCTSNQCVETAANLMKSLDLDADPCEDFYQFTCGNWAANHPIPDFTASTDWFFERKLHLAQRIRKVLEQDPLADQPIPVTQAQMLFQSCLNTSECLTS
ncbi:neprilysin-1-like [Ischnura elegans]|uniref:neprilysin-1-like n=1 Tax=Ischnura elegans TaxID=197161 RepID=UPI001ED8933A|nr:neprilysin-1-like [Ischnura elegans]